MKYMRMVVGLLVFVVFAVAAAGAGTWDLQPFVLCALIAVAGLILAFGSQFRARLKTILGKVGSA